MTGERVPPERYPWWVKFCRAGARSRTAQWLWAASTVPFAAISLFMAATDTDPIWRLILAAAGVWGLVLTGMYLATIRWMDRYGEWPS